ncbi:hypothetical protein [uncultured Paraglaciecola sp.]|uniref:hypothetical protein n=1 Tax=uncultured Paraglaciecola sp. TaxID=1765024 RepID=UPI002615DF07|nr:hypothetical protein [uncultured Paraglaciecola sp.]
MLQNLRNFQFLTFFKRAIFGLGVMFSSHQLCMAEVYQPSNNQVVANWDINQSLKNAQVSLENVEWHLRQSQYVGLSNLHLRQASNMLSKLSEADKNKPEYWYYSARILEHQHQFSDALIALEKAIEQDQKFISAWLMKSNVHLLMGQNSYAKSSCLQLVGVANVDIALACLLQTALGLEKTLEAYEKFKPVVERLQHDFENIDASNLWLVQLAADMATQLSLVQESAKWMNTYPLEKTPISYMSQWADTQIALGKYEVVLRYLGQIVQQSGYQDDALLMRLAMAEVALENKGLNLETKSEKWQIAAKSRVTLRLQRNDSYHAADLSRYFLYIEPNYKQALYWAQQNITQSQSHEDHALLTAAKAMAKEG